VRRHHSLCLGPDPVGERFGVQSVVAITEGVAAGQIIRDLESRNIDRHCFPGLRFTQRLRPLAEGGRALGENSPFAMIKFVLDQAADVFTVVVLAAFSRRERTPMPFPRVAAVISKVREPYGPKLPVMIADAVCVRCR